MRPHFANFVAILVVLRGPGTLKEKTWCENHGKDADHSKH